MSSKKKLRQQREENRKRKKMEAWEKSFSFRKHSKKELQNLNERIQGMAGEFGHPLVDECWTSSRFQAYVRIITGGEKDDERSPMKWLSIKRNDHEPIDWNHWRTLQRIKNEVAGENVDAVEVYPREENLVDCANQYHLWCFPEGFEFGIGFSCGRLVGETTFEGSKQRPGITNPMTLEEILQAKEEVAGEEAA